MGSVDLPVERVCFWNSHGFSNLSDLESFVKDSDVLCICETWLTSTVITLPGFLHNFNYMCNPASKNAIHGRASGGLMVCYNSKHCRLESILSLSNFIFVKVFTKNSFFILCLVYIPPHMKMDKFLLNFNDCLSLILQEFTNTPVIVGGDFNSRMYNLNQLDPHIVGDSPFSATRKSLDNETDKRGKLLANFMELNEFILLNGRTPDDLMGTFTYEGPFGSSILDLVWCSYNGLFMLKGLKICHVATLSDHYPVLVTLNTYSHDYDMIKGNSNNYDIKFVFDLSKSSSFYSQMSGRIETRTVYEDINSLSSVIIDTIIRVASGLGMRYRCWNRVRGNKA